jgi:phospholipase C
VISPYARENSVYNALTDTSSILKFIEDNWSLGQIGGGSYDSIAGSLDGMFNFTHRISTPLILNPSTGEPAA